MGIGRRSADFRSKKKMTSPKNKTIHSNENVMVLHQVKNWQNWKMHFLRLIFVSASASGGFTTWPPPGALPPGPPLGAFCGPQAPTFQLTFPFLIPMPGKIRCSISACATTFPGQVIPVTSELALQWPPCQVSGITGSALGLVGPVSVYCDWVRWKVGSATSISVWQHIKLSEQIRP